jgi:serine/threonine protein kinase
MIGEGGFGSVYFCSSLKKGDFGLYAVKLIKFLKSEDSAKKEQEFGYMSRLNSTYLLKYFEIFTLNNNLYFVMEYFENGTLHKLINQYQKENQKISKFVCSSLIRMYVFVEGCGINSFIVIARSICSSL